MRVARGWRLSLLSVVAVVAAQLTPFAAANATSTPSAVITSPVTGTAEVGTTSISATGTIDNTDTYQTLQLYVAGSAVGSAQTCVAVDATTCSATFSYDFTDYATASVALAVKFVTANSGPSGVMSPDVMVNVSSVPPTAAVTAPGAGATVQGLTTISTSGTVDASQNDTAVSLQLYLGGTPVGSVYPCPGSSRTCAHDFSYDFTGESGTRQLGVRFIATAKPSGTQTVDAATVAVNASSPAPTAAISSPSAGAVVSGNVSVTVAGSVDSSQTDTAKTMQLFESAGSSGTWTAASAATTCPTTSGTQSCPITLVWDATGLAAGSYNVKAVLVSTHGVSGESAPVAVNLTVPVPSATVNSPLPTDVVAGLTQVNATGSVDAGQTDWPVSLQLTVDHGTPLTAVACPTPGVTLKTCTLNLPWDATGISTGHHDLKVTLLTHRGLSVDSAVDTVTVSTPAPTAVVQPPGSLVQGPTTLTALGTVPSSQSDYAKSMQLIVDNVLRGSPVDCPGVLTSSKSCPLTFSYDFSGLSGPHTVAVRLVTNLTTVTGTNTIVAVSSPAPKVVVTPPAASVAGLVSIALTGTIDATQSDSATSLQLIVDGAPVGSPTACPSGATPKSCTVGVPWDATGLTGSHVLTAQLVTGLVPSTLSPAVTVAVANPGPTAAITSPAAGATVTGTVGIAFTGTIAAGLTDTGKSATLLVDGKVRGSAVACPASTDGHTCSTSLTFNPVGMAGPHTVAVSFVTSGGQTVVVSQQVFVFSTTQTTLAKIAPVAYGKSATVRGIVVANGTALGVAGVPVAVTFTPAVGKPRTVTVHTSAGGSFVTSYKVTGNTVVRAVLAAPAYYGPSSAHGTVAVSAAITCGSIKVVGKAATGSCKAPGLAKGVKVALQVKVGSRWMPVGKAVAGAGKVTFSASFGKAGGYVLRVVVLKGNKLFAASEGKAFGLQVG